MGLLTRESIFAFIIQVVIVSLFLEPAYVIYITHESMMVMMLLLHLN